MKTRRTLVFSLLVVLMGLSLILSNTREANALTTLEWETVAGNIDAYVDAMNTACVPYSDANNTMTCRDEEIFLSVATQVKAMLDSNGDNTIVGVGDNMANRPVLVDTLCATLTAIPGTSNRSVSPGAGACGLSGSSSWWYAANSTNALAVRTKVQAYYEAGFSPDIHVY